MRIFIAITLFFGLILGYGLYLKETYVRPTRIVRKPVPVVIVPSPILTPIAVDTGTKTDVMLTTSTTTH